MEIILKKGVILKPRKINIKSKKVIAIMEKCMMNQQSCLGRKKIYCDRLNDRCTI